MISVPVYIPIETKNREYDGKLLLASFLMNDGFKEIFIGSRSGIMRESLNNGAGIVFFKSLSETLEGYYKQLRARGSYLVLLHAEGGIHYKEMKDIMQSVYPPRLLPYMDVCFVYGEQIKRDILSYYKPGRDQKLIVTGEPRFELLKARYHPFFEQQISHLQDKYGKFILINTSFSAGNPVVGKTRLWNYISTEPTYSSKMKETFRRKMDFLVDVVDHYVSAIKSLSCHYPMINFIVRAHPSESETLYKDSFRDLKNVHVNKRGNVAEWIHAAEGIIHYDCTTGMEAVLAGKPVISYLPMRNDSVLAWLPVELSKVVENEYELNAAINDIVQGKFHNTITPSQRDKWKSVIHNIDLDSTSIISDSLANQSWDDHRRLSVASKARLVSRRYVSLLRNNVRLLNQSYRNLSFVSHGERLTKDTDILDTRSKEVENKVARLIEIDGFNYTFSVRNISRDVMRIAKK